MMSGRGDERGPGRSDVGPAADPEGLAEQGTLRIPGASTPAHGSRKASWGRKHSPYLKITIRHGTVGTERQLTPVGAGFFPQPGAVR